MHLVLSGIAVKNKYLWLAIIRILVGSNNSFLRHIGTYHAIIFSSNNNRRYYTYMALVVGRFEGLFIRRSHFSLWLRPREI